MNRKLVGSVLALAALWLSCSGETAKKSITIEVPQGFVRADGVTGAQIRAKLNGAKPEDYSLTFATDLEGSSFMPIDDAAYPPSAGETFEANLVAGSATATLYSVRTGGARVQVTYEDSTTSEIISAVATVSFGAAKAQVVSIEYVGVTPEFVSLAGSGQDTATVTFIAKDAQGQPVPDAQMVFILPQNIGGASIDPTSGTTGPDGKVSTTLKGGNSPGSVVITAVSGTLQTQSDPITIAGANVAGENFTFACEHYSVGGFEFWNLTIPCLVMVGDRNNMYKENTSITFLAEAGGIPKTMTTEEDPQTGRGRAEVIHQTQCKLPLDVAPDGSATDQGRTCDFWDDCAKQTVQRICNPRDGLVTIVAVTTGSEPRFDNDYDNKTPAANMFTDLPEPYVDANDDGTWNETETYHDTNNNKRWDDKNGKWDEITAIWVPVKILWTGAPNGSRSSITPVGDQTLNDSAIGTYTVTLRDQNGNIPAGCSAQDRLYADCGNTGCIGSEKVYDDDVGSTTISITDADPCTATDGGETCTPVPFEVEFSVDRTLDIVPQDGTGNATSVHHVLGIRRGIYK